MHLAVSSSFNTENPPTVPHENPLAGVLSSLHSSSKLFKAIAALSQSVSAARYTSALPRECVQINLPRNAVVAVLLPVVVTELEAVMLAELLAEDVSDEDTDTLSDVVAVEDSEEDSVKDPEVDTVDDRVLVADDDPVLVAD